MHTESKTPSADAARVLLTEIAGCQSRLYAYICTLLGGAADAHDVLQQTNLALWDKAAEYDAGRPFLPWAYRFAYLQVMAYRKARGRDRLLFDDEVVGRLAERLAPDEEPDRRLEALDGCLGRLSKRQRHVVDLRYREGKTVEAISAALGKAPNAVSAALYRIRAALAECIERHLAEMGT